MRLEFLKLRDYRNYKELEINFEPHVNIFIGKNGQGKSNILEAIEYCISGKSFRHVENQEVINKYVTSPLSQIKAKIDQKTLKKEVEINFSDNKRQILINNKVVGTEGLRQIFSSVIFSPESLAVVKQGPHERRALLDEIARSLSRKKAPIIIEFQKCLKTRNRILKDFAEERSHKNETMQLLETLNQLFLGLATELVALRLETVKTMQQEIKKVFSNIFSDSKVDISVDYVISGKSAIDWSQNQVYDALKIRLADLQEAELSSGQSLVGPHKHDVQFIFNGQDARTYCSQGQQRSIILAVKIAQIIKHYELHGEYPVLLLDDVFSELDFERKESLIKILGDTSAQIFMTMTEREEQSRIGQRDIKIFAIDNGQAR